MREDFAVFICTHGRPHNQRTLEYLLSHGYTGKWYLVVDDLDPTIDDYPYKDNVIIFHKYPFVEMTDTCISTFNPQLSAVLYARNAVEHIANELNLNYFVVMDDDIVGLRVRLFENGSLKSYRINQSLDQVFMAYVKYMENTPIDCLSFGCSNVFIGGDKFMWANFTQRRACHNIFIRSTKRDLKWSCVMNEDYATALRLGNIGKIFLTPPLVQQENTPNNSDVITNDGGMAKFYATTNSFVRAFYPAVLRPDVVRPRLYKGKFVIGINRNSAWPAIISSNYKKR